MIIVGTHLDHVKPKQVSSLKALIDTLYSDTMIYPAIATIACVNSTTLLLNRNSMINMLRKQIYFVATHLFLDHGKGDTYIRTYIHTYIHACMHAYKHTHIHM